MAEPALTIVATSPQPEVVDQVLAIPIDSIQVSDRLRPIDPIHMQALASLMDRDGQDTPVEVCRLPGRSDWLLVTGGHRLAAASFNGWKTIQARVVSADALERRRREIAENLFRSNLNPIDRAAFIAELVQLVKTQAGIDPAQSAQSVAAQARWRKELKKQAVDANDTMSLAYGWSDQVAEHLGLSGRTIERDLFLHRGLPAGLIAQLRGHPIAGNAGQLRGLAKLAEGEQRGVVRLLVGGKAKTVAEALARLRKTPKPDPEMKAWSAFFGGWTRMNARRRREALRELAEQGLPKGVRIVFDGGADA